MQRSQEFVIRTKSHVSKNHEILFKGHPKRVQFCGANGDLNFHTVLTLQNKLFSYFAFKVQKFDQKLNLFLFAMLHNSVIIN